MSAEVMESLPPPPAPAAVPLEPHPPTGPDVIEAYRINGIGGYFTLQQAAEFFGVQRERLQVACIQGRLPGRKITGTFGRPSKDPERQQGLWMVNVNDVMTFLMKARPGRPPGSKNKPKETTTTRRRKARELERGRLAGTVAAAATLAARYREQQAQRREELQDAGLTRRERRKEIDPLGLGGHRNEMRVRNGIRVMAELERQDEAEAQAAAQRAAYEAEYGPLEPEEETLGPPAPSTPPAPAADLSPEAAAADARRRRRASM